MQLFYSCAEGRNSRDDGVFDSGSFMDAFRRKNAGRIGSWGRRFGWKFARRWRKSRNGRYFEIISLSGVSPCTRKSRVIDGIATVYRSLALSVGRNSEQGKRNYIYLYDATSFERKSSKNRLWNTYTPKEIHWKAMYIWSRFYPA